MTTVPAAPPGRRILALDYGRRRIGVAVSDALHLLAHGRETLACTAKRELFARLQRLIQEEEIGLIVVGLPRHLSGEDSDMTKTVRAFIRELAQRVSVPVVEWDERWSSKQAERTLARRAARRQAKEKIDQLAAVLILQNYLDRLHSLQ
ncbi:MAG: Holliday junction resolvase RuvX [candidate division KSB1 bacterium]|nr:Holliday junction resolvase RuvX [candidate division KSB1 bacterium]MDZ7275465.1 Holliday junction resolvase RuvX [candidate division KSB1 bacterium]MDZ7286223.1 Holliday junction resolvase RuvX [candidate division KSB1 bacterium]MDZ7296449.1 Holliday junction resolvase RuvX [candidate division KSB1 bacterium]MDZ7307245.1 Holliday junction resolvase RuvX [candidate division KSB1 bacterium]